LQAKIKDQSLAANALAGAVVPHDLNAADLSPRSAD
jgi:hypothetical protein